MSQSGDGLCSAQMRDFLDAQHFGGGQQRGIRPRTGHDDALDAGDLRRDRRHEQSGNERKAAAGNVAADRFDGRDALADAHARLNA